MDPCSLMYISIYQSVKSYDGHNATFRQHCTLPSEGFTTKYDPLNEYIAIGCNNGSKLLFSIAEIAEVQSSTQDPVTCLKWRPNGKAKVLGVANAAGYFEYYHVPSMKKMFTIEEKDNSLHCCDFTMTGQHFATAGKDCHIRIYDQNTKSISTDLGCAEWNYRGHSNRVFSVKFIDDHTVLSGGWDSVIHLWDVRQGKSVKSFFGPHVAGDSIDFQNNQILIGCYAAKHQIQIYDYATLTQREAITWTSIQDKDKVAYVYTACFSNRNPGSILAGACGINEIKMFRKENGRHKLSVLIHGLKSGCFSIDGSRASEHFAFTTAQSGFYVYENLRQ